MPGRNDVTLLAGMAIAAIVIFWRPLFSFLQMGRDLEERYGLALVPGLVVLVVVFLGDFLMKRIRTAAEKRREAELSKAVGLGQSLARVTTTDALRDVLRHQLPTAVDAPGAWVATRQDGPWRVLVAEHRSADGNVPPDIPAIAERVQAVDDEVLGTTVEGYLCFRMPLGEGVAVLGVPAHPDDDETQQRQRLASIATLIAMAARNVQLLIDMEEHGVLDGLTGCFNRTHGMKVLDAELKRAKRARTAFSVIMFDLDYFKTVNDDYGHLCGDALLSAVGKKMQELLRNSDVKCRYGGEEFLVLLPDTPLEGAIHVAQVLRREIGEISVAWNGESVSTSASVGVAIAETGELDVKALIGRADSALYRAKHLGRNRVCVDGRPDEESSASGDAAAPATAGKSGESDGPASERRGTRHPASVERQAS